MLSKAERFWISFILRFAFGFLFLLAALNIFSYGPSEFAEQLSKPMLATWIGSIEGADLFVYYLLLSMPFVMPVLRLGALLLVCFGLGKYIQNDIPTTAADFLFALIICLGLYVLGKEPAPQSQVAVDKQAI